MKFQTTVVNALLSLRSVINTTRRAQPKKERLP